MARRRRTSTEARLQEIVTQHVDALVTALAAEVRQNVVQEIQDHFSGNGGGVAFRARRRRILPCIAPGCSNPSKGPRFHYLCDQHMNAPKRDYEAWRKAKRAHRGEP